MDPTAGQGNISIAQSLGQHRLLQGLTGSVRRLASSARQSAPPALAAVQRFACLQHHHQPVVDSGVERRQSAADDRTLGHRSRKSNDCVRRLSGVGADVGQLQQRLAAESGHAHLAPNGNDECETAAQIRPIPGVSGR